MSEIGDRIEASLNEARMLLLGGQVLLGFSYRPYFESSFDRLSREAQVLHTAGLVVMTAGLVWLLYPAPFHQIAERGNETPRVDRVNTNVLDWALLPFALGMAVWAYVIADLQGSGHPWVPSLLTGAFTVTWWYGVLFFQRPGNEGKSGAEKKLGERSAATRSKKEEGGGDAEEASELKDKIKKMLLECRMILPGVQALLGFQLTTFFMQGFEKLPGTSKWIHAVGLAGTAVATVLIITPAAFHRMAEHGENTLRFHRVGSRLMLSAMVFLGIGLYADMVVIAEKMGMSLQWAGTGGILLLLVSYGFWFGGAWWARE